MHLSRTARSVPPRALAGTLIVVLLAACSPGGAATGPRTSAPVPATATTASSPGAAGGECEQASPRPTVSVPKATALASPPSEPASDGTTATIVTELGDVTIELFSASAPVAATNFVNLAEAGFYQCVVFHRLVPGFVIQGGDPSGDGTGGPGYEIQDEPVVGTYARGIVAMARTQRPNSQGSQFFIVLDDAAEPALERYRTYVIFGRVTNGMDVVDRIAAMPNSGEQTGNQALEPVAMKSVTIKRP